MSLSVHQSSVGVYRCRPERVSGHSRQGAAHAAARKFDPAVYMTLRLRPDMLAFAAAGADLLRQRQDASARLAGVEAPRLRGQRNLARRAQGAHRKTLDFLATLDAKAIDGSADREIVFPLGPNKMKMQGDNYLLHFALPNFYFHLTTAYDLLRYAGVEIGKRDFLGAVPGIGPPEPNPMQRQYDEHRTHRRRPAHVAGRRAWKHRSISPARSPTKPRARASANRRRRSSPIIDGLLAKAGADKTQILSTTIYLADIKTFAEMNAVWDAWVPPGHTPARATVEAKLAAPQYTVEIACIAAKPAR